MIPCILEVPQVSAASGQRALSDGPGLGTGSTGSGRSMFVRLGGRVGRLVSAVPNIERPDPV